MVQDENGEETPFDERAAVNPSNAALLASRIQLSWRKHHAKRVASALDICVGMQVERVLENKWHPAVVSRVYSGGVVDIIYSGVTEATEELGVSLSFIRAAKNLTITQPDYVSSSNSWQVCVSVDSHLRDATRGAEFVGASRQTHRRDSDSR